MSRLTIHTVESAPEAAQARVATALKNNGFLPNLIGVLANAPTALEMYQEVGAINAKTSLTPAEREVVQITAAVTNGCGFCVAGHCALSTKKNLMSPELIDALRHTSALSDTKLNQLAQFTLAVMHNKGNVSDTEFNDFIAAGYNQQQAVEVILGVALATLCNYTNNLAQTPINPELQPYA